MRLITTQAFGIRLPILKTGDDLISIITNSVLKAVKTHQLVLKDHDIISVTEALVARTQGNYASIEDIKNEVLKKYDYNTPLGVVFPMLSRNRFALVLEAIALGNKRVIVQFSYPADEVGNQFLDEQLLIEKQINPYQDAFDEKSFRDTFGYNTKHMFTNIDYIEFYKSLSDNIEIVFSNDPNYIYNYTNQVLVADVHTRHLTKVTLQQNKAGIVYGLDELLTEKSEQHGYNPTYGLLGSNKANETSVKLFPRDTETFVINLQAKIYQETNKKVEVVVFGDGAFKDPIGKIWELADPVSAIAFTDGLKGRPHELKIKYLADNTFQDLSGAALDKALIKSLKEKNPTTASSQSIGTTPRQIADLVCSLSDLISGSGDKGTPVVLIQGYFDNYSDL